MLNIESLKQSLKIEVIEKKSFGDNIADMLNPQNLLRYDLLEWYFHQPFLKELVEGHNMDSYRKFNKVTAYDGLLKQLFPTLIFQRTMIDYQWHYTLRRLEATYPLEFQQFLRKLQIYEKYVLMVRKNNVVYQLFFEQQSKKIMQQIHKFNNEEKAIPIKELKQKSKNSDEEMNNYLEANHNRTELQKLKNNAEKSKKALETLKDLVEGKIWHTNKDIKLLLKSIELDHTVENDFYELTKYINELIDFPAVHELINMGSIGTSIPLWLAIIGATCRLKVTYSFEEGFTEAEKNQMELTLKAFNNYDTYQELFIGKWDTTLDVKDFVSYYAKNPNLLEKIASNFTIEQQIVAFKQLMVLEEHVIIERLIKDPNSVPYFEAMLKTAVTYVEDQTIAKFRQQFTELMTTQFIEDTILHNKSYVWLTLIEPSRIFKVLARRHTHEQLQLLKVKLVKLLHLDWSNLQQIGMKTYCKYWEFLYESDEDFRVEVLSNPIYIVRYDKAQGDSQSVWNWLKENAFKEEHTFIAKPIVGVDHVMKKVGTTEQVNQWMAKWVDNPENFDVLREMNFTMMTGNEEGVVSASTVLQSSMFFELEDEMLTDKFENYQFIVKSIGIKSPDGTVLRRAKIKAQLLVNEEEDLDDWLASLDNL